MIFIASYVIPDSLFSHNKCYRSGTRTAKKGEARELFYIFITRQKDHAT